MRPRPEGRGERGTVAERFAHRRCRFNAATTRRPWRTWRTRCPSESPLVASMRPRPEGRGERDRKPPPDIMARGASMRPRPEGRGERRVPLAMVLPGYSFNAATTRRPWRTRTNRPAPPASGRFNAATTRRPWRTRRADAVDCLVARLQCGHDPKAVENGQMASRVNRGRRASMRPRPEGRGEPRQPRVGRTVRATGLQCGHDPKAVENTTIPRTSDAGRHSASMRPRPEGRGEPRG